MNMKYIWNLIIVALSLTMLFFIFLWVKNGGGYEPIVVLIEAIILPGACILKKKNEERNKSKP